MNRLFVYNENKFILHKKRLRILFGANNKGILDISPQTPSTGNFAVICNDTAFFNLTDNIHVIFDTYFSQVCQHMYKVFVKQRKNFFERKIQRIFKFFFLIKLFNF